MARTALFARKQVGGAFVYANEMQGTGELFFVHSGTGTNAVGGGQNPDAPLATIDYAVGLCTASKGDKIIVMPGHAETIVGAAGIALDVAGVSIIGLGNGRNRPVITFTTADAASFDISAANCLVQNLSLVNGRDGQTAMVNVSAADVSILGCEFQIADASTQAVLGILTTAAANRLLVQGNQFNGTVDAGVTGCVRLVGGSFCRVLDNTMVGMFAVTGAIENVTTAGVMHSYCGNFIVNLTADGNNKAIVAAAATNGIIANNRMAVIDSTSPAPVTAAAMYVSGNYFTGAAGVTASTLM